MSDSLLDEALGYCHEALLDMHDTPVRNQLRARLGFVERVSWSLSLLPATELQVVNVARLALDLRDDVARARSAETIHMAVPVTALAIAEASSSIEPPST